MPSLNSSVDEFLARQDVSHLAGTEDSEAEIEAKITEDETAASDDESESDDEDSRHRGRFKTERTTTSGSLLSKSRNKLEKREIPDKLGMYGYTQERQCLYGVLFKVICTFAFSIMYGATKYRTG